MHLITSMWIYLLHVVLWCILMIGEYHDEVMAESKRRRFKIENLPWRGEEHFFAAGPLSILIKAKTDAKLIACY